MVGGWMKAQGVRKFLSYPCAMAGAGLALFFLLTAFSWQYMHFGGEFAWHWLTSDPIAGLLALQIPVLSGFFFLLGLRRDRAMARAELLGRRLEEQTHALIHAGKMSALGEMAGGIAHEINNPLAIISARLDHLRLLSQQGRIEKGDLLVSVEKAQETVMRIANIVRGLRSFSRDSRAEEAMIVPVGKIVRDTLEFCQPRFVSSNILLEIRPIPDDLVLRCKPVQVSQVLLNLLNNACDAVQELPLKRVSCEVMNEGDSVIFRICDSGPGVPAAIREKIMDPFFTTKEAGKGTGLGLSISRSIVESHGGSLRLEPSSNSCFLAVFPKGTKGLDQQVVA